MQERIDVPCDTEGVPRGSWLAAMIGTGGQAQRRLLKGSGCSAISLKGSEADLRSCDKLFVELKAATKDGMAEGVARVQRAIADVLAAHGAAPSTPPPLPPPQLQPPPAEPAVVVPPSAPGAPPPVWGSAVSAAPPPAPADEGSDEQSCGLCMIDVVANVRLEPCGHRACVACVASLRRRALFVSVAGVPCPYCRTTVVRYDAPPGVDVGLQPSAAPETSLALRATLPPLEIRRPPPAVVRPPQAPVHPKFKTSLCSSWRESGTCDFGSRCYFAHGEAELRAPQRAPPAADSRDFAAGFQAGSADDSSWRSAGFQAGSAPASRWAAPNDAAETPAEASPPPPDERKSMPAQPAAAALEPAAPAQPAAAPAAAEPALTAAAPEAAAPETAAPAHTAAAPEAAAPAQAAAAPEMPPWLLLALGAQVLKPAPAAAAPAPPLAPPGFNAPAAPKASLAGTPWEMILDLEDNGF